MSDPVEKTLDIYLSPVRERKILSIAALDVAKLTSYTDIIIILEGRSKRQVTSLAEHIVKRLKDQKIKPLSQEGVSEGEWALLDYGDLIFHIFETRMKSFYDLEGLWADAPRIDLSAFDLTLESRS